MYTLAQLSSAFEVMMKADFRLEMNPNDSVVQAEFDSAAEEYGRIVAYFESSPAVRLTDEAVYERDRFYHGLTESEAERVNYEWAERNLPTHKAPSYLARQSELDSAYMAEINNPFPGLPDDWDWHI